MRVDDLQRLRADAHRCRSLASTTLDQRVRATLQGMALDYDAQVAEIEKAPDPGK